MKKLFLLLPLVLAGCTTVGDYQNQCEQRYSKLSDVANCLDSDVKSDFRMSRADTPKLYVSAAKMLGEAVDQGKMTDAQARYELQSLYVNIKQKQDALANERVIAINNAVKSPQQIYTEQSKSIPVRQPVTTNCTGYGNSVTCNSY